MNENTKQHDIPPHEYEDEKQTSETFQSVFGRSCKMKTDNLGQQRKYFKRHYKENELAYRIYTKETKPIVYEVLRGSNPLQWKKLWNLNMALL